MSNYLIGTLAFLVLGVIFTVCYLVDKRDEQKIAKGCLGKLNENEALHKKDNKQVKPRISPPVHSMLELMMRQPEGFENTRDEYFKGGTWKHKESSTCFTKTTNWSGDIEYYYINLCSITKEEGEYLQQGVYFIEAYKKSVKESANKKHRHEVDRKIREVLEGL